MNAYHKRCPILVLGIGNILLRDEGIGVHVVEYLKNKVPDFVELVDGGTAGADLLDVISDRDKVIIVDAVDAEVEHGTILRMKPEDLEVNTGQSVSLHEFGIGEMLAAAKYLGCAPHDVIIFGIKPQDISCGVGISKELIRIVPQIADIVLAEITTTDTIRNEAG